MRLFIALAAMLMLVPVAHSAAASPPVTSAVTAPFGPQERANALERIAVLIESNYVCKDKGGLYAAEIRGWKADPELARASDAATWAAILSRRLVVHDAHFSVFWSAPSLPTTTPAAANQQGPEAEDAKLGADNYGFDAVERLPGNIGYIRTSYFAGFDTALTGEKTPGARKAAEAALRLVSKTDAVIFDMRENTGGSPDMVDFLLTGFLEDKPLLLLSLFVRESPGKIDFTTVANYTGPRRPNVPVFVLTSGGTASGAEAFAYLVQTLKRGVVVGETTAGAANPGGHFDAGNGLQVFISRGAPISPITKTNWEGAGVKPDLAVPAAQALRRAHVLALEAALGRNISTAGIEARWTLDRLNAEGGSSLPESELAAYVGDFGGRRVTLENGQLFYHRDRAPAERMIPVGDNVFALEDEPTLRLSFEHEKDRPAAAMVLTRVDGAIVRLTRSTLGD